MSAQPILSMSSASPTRLSSRALRAELSRRNLPGAEALQADISYGRLANVVHSADEDGGHGNFLRASYRRILANPDWARRLEKTYTGSQHLPRATDRWRGELECSSSSDALLLNIFCYPGVLRRLAVCQLLGVERGLQPRFGIRAELPMRKGEVDRTEFDMRLGSTVAEAKLTEGGVGRASRERLLRYENVEEIFDLDSLPQRPSGFHGYQLIRGVLGALAEGAEGNYLVLLDARRADLVELCFQVLSAVRGAEIRHRLRLRTWQELATVLPPTLQEFLDERFGIVAT